MTYTTNGLADPDWLGTLNMNEAIDACDRYCEQIFRIVEATRDLPEAKQNNVRFTAARFLIVTARQVLEGTFDGPEGAAIAITNLARVQEKLWENQEQMHIVQNDAGVFEVREAS